jgi:lysosomal alpha-mannosidase
VQEVQQIWNPWCKQVTRLYQGVAHIEFEPTIGPIDISDNLGKEVVSRFSTDLATNSIWYTDSEGQEMIQRKRNYRPWNYTITEPIASNYYPMNEAAYIQDTSKNLQLTILTDRSRGCGSLADGQIETMIHRRCLYDDGRGVGEPLNQSDIIKAKELVFFDVPSNSSQQQRPSSLLFNNPPILAFSSATDATTWLKNYQTTWTPMSQPLPPNVHLLNLKTVSEDEVILRVNHIYAVNESAMYSKVVTVDLGALFSNLQIVKMTEMTMTSNRPRAELHRLQWKTSSSSDAAETFRYKKLTPWTVQLKPMDIRTFRVTYQNS